MQSDAPHPNSNVRRVAFSPLNCTKVKLVKFSAPTAQVKLQPKWNDCTETLENDLAQHQRAFIKHEHEHKTQPQIGSAGTSYQKTFKTALDFYS